MPASSRIQHHPHPVARVAELVGSIRPLTARSVLASILLGARVPRLPVSHLVAGASLFGITPSAARTCLSRMAMSGELTSEEGSYALAGRLLERRKRVGAAARGEHTPRRAWDGSWELAIVSLERRAASDRGELRKAAAALHLAELREGVWIRPDNLDPQRLPLSRAVIDQQCVHFHGAQSDIDAEVVRTRFGLDAWARDARQLERALTDLLDAEGEQDDVPAAIAYQFALSIAVVRHLQLDPLLPEVFTPDDWPVARLRKAYRRFDQAFYERIKRVMRAAVE